MRETRLSGSEGGGTGNLTGPTYPYHLETEEPIMPNRRCGRHPLNGATEGSVFQKYEGGP